MASEPLTRHGVAHPIVFLVLYLPYGVAMGYVIVTLGYLLPFHGLTVAQVAAVMAVLLLPQTWKVIWAPLIDTTLSLRRWYGLGIVVTSAFMLALPLTLLPGHPAHLRVMDALVFALSISSSSVMMATESLMAHATSPAQKGRAAGWCQAGGLGGQGLGGGAGLWLAQHRGLGTATIALALVCLVCCVVLWTVPMPPRQAREQVRARLVEVAKDVWSIARSRIGFLAGLLVFLPVGTAAASNLWSAVAGDWHASADTVALANGLLSGVIASVGCLVGGYFCDLINRKAGYVLAGLALAACAVAMALAPRTPTTFVIFVSAYAFLSGCVYAAFTAVALETIGRGAAATKYNVLACLANIPITYMMLVDGTARTHFGPAGMLYTEAGIAVLAVLVFGAVAAATRRTSTDGALTLYPPAHP